MFESLKEAITNVTARIEKPNTNSSQGFVVVPLRDMMYLLRTYNEFFVEPEDDKEWNSWQSS
jgi:hypothetical protein